MSMKTSPTSEIVISTQPQPNVARGSARQCVVVDRSGKRMVLPRYSAADAIEQIAMAIAGRTASPDEKRLAWEHLRDKQGFTVKWLEPKLTNNLPPAIR